MQLNFTEFDGGIRRIDIQGRMDMDGTESIGTQLTYLISTEKALVAIDLSQVEFMSSIGVGVIVRAMNALRQRGGKLVLVNPQPVVSLVLQKTAIDTIVPVVRDWESAVRALRA
jgi:anti-sigma B factor antagonist